MFLVVGLGNPGAEYVKTRHNVGFTTADAIADEYNFSPFRNKFDGLIAEGRIGKEKVYLLKPQTYMNLSGNSVVKAASFYKILPQNIIVIHDDMDLPIGRLKVKMGGGSGGHNGLKSIDAAVTSNYNRIRIGVGHPQGGKEDVVNYVLGGFSKTEAQEVAKIIEFVVNNISVMIDEGLSAFSNLIGMAIHKNI